MPLFKLEKSKSLNSCCDNLATSKQRRRPEKVAVRSAKVVFTKLQLQVFAIL
jgi:hypothetical protein